MKFSERRARDRAARAQASSAVSFLETGANVGAFRHELGRTSGIVSDIAARYEAGVISPAQDALLSAWASNASPIFSQIVRDLKRLNDQLVRAVA